MATQDNRFASVETSLGKDAVLFKSFSGAEGLNENFSYMLEVYSEKGTVTDILGESISVKLLVAGGKTRLYSGYVISVETQNEPGVYGLEIRPWFSLLAYASDCRVYKKCSVKDLIEEVFSRHTEIAKYQFRLSGSYDPVEFQAQYNETDMSFVIRRMNQSGLYYFFEHDSSGNHEMIITDHRTKHKPAEGYAQLKYHPNNSNPSRDEEMVYFWSQDLNFESGLARVKDFNYQKSKTKLDSKDSQQGALKQKGRSYELVSYPGGFADPGTGKKMSQLMAEAQVAAANVYRGATRARGLSPGARFTLSNHPNSKQDGEYLVTNAHYGFSGADYVSGGSEGSEFDCSFEAIQQSVQYRSAATGSNDHPVVFGVQTATVSGPSGKEIYTDPEGLGRVKVKFHWDSSDHEDENSSDWVRVCQTHAGRGFGSVDFPRIGDEVLVEFEHGNPDYPIIVGRVYNDFNSTPVDLPAKNMVSGIKTNSTPGGGGYHELLFDDTKGNELISVHSQKDMTLKVENDYTTEIVNNEKRDVGKDQKLTVGGEQTIAVKSSATRDVTSTYDIKAGSTINITSSTDIKLSASGSTIEIGPQGVTIKTSGVVQVQGSVIKLN